MVVSPRFPPNADVVVYDGEGTEGGSFTRPVGESRVAVGDVDRDGVDEVVFAGASATVPLVGQVAVFEMSGATAGGFTVSGEVDGLAMSDVDGDGADDILVAHDTLIRGYDESGAVLSQFAENVFNGDQFAAGYVDGDGKADIVVADAAGPFQPGEIRISNASGSDLGSFSTAFGAGDGLALGDVAGDAKDEILLADAGTDQVRVLDSAGAQIAMFPVAYSSPSGFAAGDVDGDGVDEIVVVNENTDTVIAYGALGSLVSSFGADMSVNYRMAVGTFGDGDLDGDGIPDRVERLGLRRSDGTTALDLPALGASPCRKTIPVEMDYMSGDGHSHVPEPEAVAEMVAAFDDAPVPGAQPCPYAGAAADPGIDLIAMVDDPVAEGPLATEAQFDAIKSANFDQVLRPYVHYNLWAHTLAGPFSGMCCFGEDEKDIVVSLGAAKVSPNGTVRQQSLTFMHELGHAMGLGHGGADWINYKPNYLSVMNNSFPVGLQNADDAIYRVDFSRAELPPLDELNLDEAAGIGDGPILTSWGNGLGFGDSGRGDGPLDWSGDDHDGNGVVDDDTGVVADLDHDEGGDCVVAGADATLTTTPQSDDVVVDGNQIRGGHNRTCDTTAATGDAQAAPVGTVRRVLHGHDDWANLVYRGDAVPGALAPGTFDEPTIQELEQITEQWYALLDPDLRVTTSVTPTGPVPGDTLTYTVTVANTGTGRATDVMLANTRPDGTTTTQSLPDLKPGASLTRTVAHTVPANTPGGTALTHTATATATDLAGGPEEDTADNTASTVTVVRSNADLEVTVTDTPDPTMPFAVLDYVVTVHNLGPMTANEVTADIAVPDQVHHLDTIATQGTCTGPPGTVHCSLGTVPSGGTAVVTITVTVAAPAGTTLTATAATASHLVDDPVQPNDTATATTKVCTLVIGSICVQV